MKYPALYMLRPRGGHGGDLTCSNINLSIIV